MRLPIAERFKAPQGEGMYAGTPMAFIRTVGCSVGQGVCTSCDTDFSKMFPQLGGGLYSPAELAEWARPYRHACVTGGEPLDRDLRDLLLELENIGIMPHVETSGTVWPGWLGTALDILGSHPVRIDAGMTETMSLWVCVSPKPGYLEDMVMQVADEVKVILGGLGDGPGWPTVEDAVRWSDAGKLVYLQPRNGRFDVDRMALQMALKAVDRNPQLRLSVQLHKFLRTR